MDNDHEEYYDAPTFTVITVAAERGFALSDLYDGGDI